MHEFFAEVKTDENGAHKVHTAECPEAPESDKLRWIGVRSTSAAALKEAANWFGNSTPCPTCITR